MIEFEAAAREGFVAARLGAMSRLEAPQMAHCSAPLPGGSLNYVLDLARLGCVQGGAQEHLDGGGHGGEASVFGEALVVAVINLLDDYG